MTGRPSTDHTRLVADLAENAPRLLRKPLAERRIALVLAHSSNTDDRIGTGFEPEMPASAIALLQALRAACYAVRDIPVDGAALIRRLTAGTTGDQRTGGRALRESLSLADYQLFFATLPKTLREAVTALWGAPESDPFYRPGATDCGHFPIAAVRCGAAAVGLQPAHTDSLGAASDDGPAVAPPHSSLAFYGWLRDAFRADVVVHVGRRGKAAGLRRDDFPEAALDPVPLLYPFVTDSAEEIQLGRRGTTGLEEPSS